MRRATTPAADTAAPAPPGPVPWWLALHPLFFALTPVVSLGGANGQEISPADLVRPIMATVLLTAALWGVFWLALRRDVRRSALLASGLVFWTFSYALVEYVEPQIESVAGNYFFVLDRIDSGLLTKILWALCVLATLAAVVRLRAAKIEPATRVAGAFGLALFAAGLANMVWRGEIWAPPVPAGSPAASTDPLRPLSGQPQTAAAPDIYFIVNDAYARRDVLQRYYGFDNGPFVRELEKRGFFVARDSHANYDQTPLALAAALGMGYLDDLARQAPRFAPQALHERIDRNAVAAFLKDRGYRFVAVASDFEDTRSDSADLLLMGPENLNPYRMTAFETLLIGRTPLRLLPSATLPFFDAHRQIVAAAWDNLDTVARLQTCRKFVFVHVLAPHPPFVFGPHGEPIEPKANRVTSLEDGSDYLRAGGTEQDYVREYPDQLQYVNQRTLEAIDSIRAHSAVPPIVVVIGDHGSRLHLNFDSLAGTDVGEFSGNLVAVCLPDGSAARVFGDDITPVNVFRLLFDHQFGSHYGRLPDRTYYSTSTAPLTFTDVTDRAAPRPSS